MAKLIGTDPNQIPTNQMLGSMAYQDATAVKVGDIRTDAIWKDMLAPISAAGVPNNSAPAMTAFGPVTTPRREEYAFAVNDYVFLQPFHVNHDIFPGARAYLHVHWSTSGTDTGNVKWEMTLHRALGHNQANFGAAIVKTVEQAAQGSAWRHYVTEVGDADALSLIEPDELLLVTVRRVAASTDENTDTVFGLMVDLHYEADRTGTPYKAPNFFNR